MSEIAVQSLAKATLHLRVLRVNGALEEYEVPIETTLTTEEVQALIARVPKDRASWLSS